MKPAGAPAIVTDPVTVPGAHWLEEDPPEDPEHETDAARRAPTARRPIPEATWGGKEARIFAFEPLALYAPRIPDVPDGEAFTAARARVNPADLAPPEHGLDMTGRRVRAA